jgi:CheY-like chemotaxis protein
MVALSVLIVEDDAMVSMLLAEMLGDMGYAVCAIAATEDEAVTDAARYHPGLMIVDQQLREGSGISAMDRILQTGPVPCVFISGAPMQPGRVGATLLVKPFLQDDLIHAIQHVVSPSGTRAPRRPFFPCIVSSH